MSAGNALAAPVLCLLVLIAAPAAADGPPISGAWPGLSASGLPTVYVLTETGTETSGKLLALGPDSLVLLVGGLERRFDAAEIARVQKRDSIRNGTIIGALAGVAMGLVAAGISDCPGAEPGGSCAALRMVTFGISVGTYAALGAGVDALIRGRTTIYAAPIPGLSHASIERALPAPAVRVAFSW